MGISLRGSKGGVQTMILVGGITLPLSYTDAQIEQAIVSKLHISKQQLASYRLHKRSVDARHKSAVSFQITVAVTLHGDETACVESCRTPDVRLYTPPVLEIAKVSQKSSCRPIVVGCGPAGLFAALTLSKAGLSPLLLERGESVEKRRQSVEQFRRTGILNTQSNVQFGEGGAGTFSDGKLNTGIKDPRVRYVLEELVKVGAPQEILWQAKPHVGTDRLCDAVVGLRQKIQSLGGEIRFNATVTDITVRGNALNSVIVNESEEIPCTHLILAVGHSARDTVEMLYRRGVSMQRKPFAVGVRIEHPRHMIDVAQYGKAAGHPALGAADYKLACRTPDNRGVYTFCMCPGGVVIAAASEQGGVAVNGMSNFARDAQNSNSALLVEVTPGDIKGDSPLDGIYWQRKLEQTAFKAGGGGYKAPVQLVGDFLAYRNSTTFGEVQPSYLPGTTFADLHHCLPPFVAQSLVYALPRFGKQLHGFDRPDALLVGVESRSSSPVRMLRNDQCESSVTGIYPCGEGAGYAGGITSAAVDGIRLAQAVINSL